VEKIDINHEAALRAKVNNTEKEEVIVEEK